MPQESPVIHNKLTPKSSGVSWSTLIKGYIVFVSLGIISHWPALYGGFIWDDDAHVTRKAIQSLSGLLAIWTKLGSTQQYYPLLHSLFWVQHFIWSDSSFAYHLTNISLHAFACLLLVLVLKKLSIPGAWLAGLVFTLHPIYVESIAWISEEKNTISAIFYFSSAFYYLHFEEKKVKKYYIIATVFFVLALLTKTVTATLPSALLLLIWWKNGELLWKRDIKPLRIWFGASIVAGIFTSWVESNLVGAQGTEYIMPSYERILLSGRIICFYISKIILPTHLVFIYERWTISRLNPISYAYLAVAIGLLVVCIWLYLLKSKSAEQARSLRTPLASYLYFCGTLLPVLGFFNIYPFKYSYVADHFQYLASLGIVVPICSLASLGIKSVSHKTKLLSTTLCVLVLVCFTYLTVVQSNAYQNAKTLYQVTLDKNPECWMAHNNIGVILLDEGKTDLAASEFEAALQLNPNLVGPHANLGNIYSKNLSTQNKAFKHYEAAIAQAPNSADIHNLYGTFLTTIPEKHQDAFNQIQKAIELQPNYPEAHYNLGILLSQFNDRQNEAIEEYKAALTLNPDYVQAHTNLAIILAHTQGGQNEAIAHLRKALEIDPGYAEAHCNIAPLLASDPSQLNDAISHLEKALSLKPNFAQAHNNLANLFAHIDGKDLQTIYHYSEAIRINPNYAEAENNWANYLVRKGNHDNEAIDHYRKAIAIAPEYIIIRYNLALLLMRNPAAKQEAVDNLERLLQIAPNYQPAKELLNKLK